MNRWMPRVDWMRRVDRHRRESNRLSRMINRDVRNCASSTDGHKLHQVHRQTMGKSTKVLPIDGNPVLRWFSHD